mgnify:CR=1 FL=1
MNKNKVQPKTLPGFMELLPNEQILFNEMKDKIKKSYERFGFLPLNTPIIESAERKNRQGFRSCALQSHL